MIGFRSGASLITLVSLSLGAVGGLATAGAEIIDGTEATGFELPEVFSIAAPGTDGAEKLCTATLIHSRVLLTAAHCLPTNSKTVVTVKSGINARRPNITFKSVRTYRHGTYFSNVSETRKTGFDIGIIILSSAVPPSLAAPVALGASNGDVEINAAESDGVFVVGYGGKNNVQVDATTGIKRWAQTQIIESGIYSFSTKGAASAQSKGDSGGPAYIVDSTGQRRLIGVASGTPVARVSSVTGRPEASLYTAMRRSLACWIETNSGITLPEFTGALACQQKATGEFGD